MPLLVLFRPKIDPWVLQENNTLVIPYPLTVPDTLCQASVMVRGLEKHADANPRRKQFEMEFICSFGTLQQDGLNIV